MANDIVFALKALTDIWTGGVEGKPNELHLTGIKGSLRWWYEVLVRGLDKYVCNPTQKEKDEKTGPCRFELSKDEKQRIENGEATTSEIAKQKICPACYLFGCTGWSGKFNLRIRGYKEKKEDDKNEDDKEKDDTGEIITKQITAGTPFILEFVQKKRFDPAEDFLLKMTLKLIVDFGAIGGKTVLKPSEFPDKNTKTYENPQTHAKGHHLDYGVVERHKDKAGNNISGIPTEKIYDGANKNEVDIHLKDFSKSAADNESNWPDLRNFWFVEGDYIKRNEHNAIVKRDSAKPKYYLSDAQEINKWLGGDIAKSKKIFSFHGIDPNDQNKVIPGVRRCFGYAKKEGKDIVISLIKSGIPILITGEKVIRDEL